jgi:hypothetical protein
VSDDGASLCDLVDQLLCERVDWPPEKMDRVQRHVADCPECLAKIVDPSKYFAGAAMDCNPVNH